MERIGTMISFKGKDYWGMGDEYAVKMRLWMTFLNLGLDGQGKDMFSWMTTIRLDLNKIYGTTRWYKETK